MANGRYVYVEDFARRSVSMSAFLWQQKLSAIDHFFGLPQNVTVTIAADAISMTGAGYEV
jgi:hypothetical protein